MQTETARACTSAPVLSHFRDQPVDNRGAVAAGASLIARLRGPTTRVASSAALSCPDAIMVERSDGVPKVNDVKAANHARGICVRANSWKLLLSMMECSPVAAGRGAAECGAAQRSVVGCGGV
jgi:hypothetical protein